MKKKYIHIVILILIIFVILFIVGISVLRYNVEGETNMPFYLSKISIISSSEGIDKQVENTKWAFDINQTNDIFLSIDKNEKYGKTEIIQEIEINNIQIESNKKENIKLYKPDSQEEKTIFKNKDENIIENLKYEADVESNLKQLKISNQGGVIAIRCSNNNLAEYVSNDEQEINHSELLKKANINEEDLKIKLSFDLIIKLDGGKEYKSNILLELPIEGIVEKGTSSKEMTDLKEFVFKRENN